MNTGKQHQDDIGDEIAAPRSSRPPSLVLLAVLIFAEAVLLFGVVGWLLIELVTTKPASVFGGIALILIAAIAAAWVLLTGVGTLRGRSWVRGAIVTWQVVQIAIAVGCFQGLYAEPVLGWALLVPSIIAILLVISPQVTSATRRVERTEH